MGSPPGCSATQITRKWSIQMSNRVSKSDPLRVFFATIALVLILGLPSALHAQTFQTVPALAFTKVFAGAEPLPQVLTIAYTDQSTVRFSTAASTNSGRQLVVGLSRGRAAAATRRSPLRPIVSRWQSGGRHLYRASRDYQLSPMAASIMTIPVTLTVAASGATFFDDLPGKLSFSFKTGGNRNLAGRPDSKRRIWHAELDPDHQHRGWRKLAERVRFERRGSVQRYHWHHQEQSARRRRVRWHLRGPIALPGLRRQRHHSGGGHRRPLRVYPDQSARLHDGVRREPILCAQVLNVAMSDNSTVRYSVSVATAKGGNWLAISPAGGGCCNTPLAEVVSVNTSSIPAGAYTGEIIITEYANPGRAMVVPVTSDGRLVRARSLLILPGQLSFSVKTNGATATSQTVQVTNGGSGTLNWTVATTTADGGNWLTATPSSGTAPSASR